MARRNFHQIEVGQFFRGADDTLYQRIPEGSVEGWQLANAINLENGCHSSFGPLRSVEVVERPTHRRATSKQMAYLSDLGVQVSDQISVQAASRLIDKARPSCHYCGMTATGFGFFDEPVCRECGG